MHPFLARLVTASLAFGLSACGGTQARTGAPAAKAAGAAELPATAVCPVSKKHFKPDANTPRTRYKGRTYYFCCPGCPKKFAAHPEKYVAPGDAAAVHTGPEKGPKKPCPGDCDDKDGGAGHAAAGAGPKKPCPGDCDDKDGGAGHAAARVGHKKPCTGDCDDKVGGGKSGGIAFKTAEALGTKLPLKATCPISGKTFEVKPDTKVAVYQGKTYYFCCPRCAMKFAAKMTAAK